MRRGLFIAILIVAAVAGVGKRLAIADRPDAFQDGGDCPYYAATAASLLQDGDFDLRNQLTADGRTLDKHSGFIAVSPDGTIVPKHSVLMPILSVPFLAVFGKFGLLVFNVGMMCSLIYAVSLLGGDTPAVRIVALIGYLSTPFMGYTFNYSPDVLGAVLVVWTFVAASREKWVWCGLLAGLAVWAKLYLAVILLPVSLLLIPGGWRGVLKAGASTMVVMIPMLAINAALYGGPLVTGYDREAYVTTDNEVFTADHYSLFNQPMLQGLVNLLFDDKIGMLQTAPLWFLWPAGAWVLFRSGGRERLIALALSLAIVANLLLFSRYDQWNASIRGNRFLFPTMALGLALLGPLAQQVSEWMSRMRARRVATAPPASTVSCDN